MIRGKFWTKTGFVTKSFEEAVLWISVLRDKGFIFAMTVRVYEKGELYYLFAVNVNSIIADELIRDEGFHDEFPITDGIGVAE